MVYAVDLDLKFCNGDWAFCRSTTESWSMLNQNKYHILFYQTTPFPIHPLVQFPASHPTSAPSPLHTFSLLKWCYGRFWFWCETLVPRYQYHLLKYTGSNFSWTDILLHVYLVWCHITHLQYVEIRIPLSTLAIIFLQNILNLDITIPNTFSITLLALDNL